MSAGTYRLLADLVLILHASFVVFVVLGLLVIICGGVCRWQWIRNPWFRTAHLGAIALVVFQAWLGIICPLTIFENYLRENAGEHTYGGSFIAHWLHKALFFHAPPWAFVLCYTLFGIAVIFSWIKFRPRPFRRDSRTDS
jgi:hypothetical protein